MLHGLPDTTETQVSCSLENPHFNMFTLDQPTCVRNRLSAFHVVQGFSAPAVRCSSALMLRCTLASRGSSRSLHSSKRAAFAVVLMGLVHVIQLFRDFRRDTTPRSQQERPRRGPGNPIYLIANSASTKITYSE